MYGVLAVISKIQVVNYLHMSRGSSARDIAFDPSSGARLELTVPTVNIVPDLKVNTSDAYASNTTATGPYCFALGELAEAAGDSSNTSIGYNANHGAVDADFLGSTAIGNDTFADGNSCFALGNNAFVESGKFQASAVGRAAYANGDRAFAMGYNSEANFNYALALGEEAIAGAIEAVAVGYQVSSQGFHVGNGITSTGTTSFGINSGATGADCFEIGDDSLFGMNWANSCSLLIDNVPLLYVDANGCRTEAIVAPTIARAAGYYTIGATVAAADFRDGTTIIYNGAAGTLITPTAAEIIAAHPGAIDNDCFDITVFSTTNALSWVGGTGVTFNMGSTGYTDGLCDNNTPTTYTCVLDVTNEAVVMYFMHAYS